jgi:CheY-like chemotaxis protein/anti-sigma regulatory factor (Ser/Thr protein kinase)
MGFMEIIESNNSRLLSLVNEILDLSRVESGEIVIKKAPTNLDQLMTSIKQLFKFRCPETVSLTYTKPSQPATMNTDENRLTQVFSNLISNALKHTTRGSITFGYDIIEEGHKIRFFVKDTGSGISPDFIDHIFDAYASKDAEQQKGYGLGLALCKIIVEKMEGTISVESTEGKGTTFTFDMPFHGTFGGLSTSNRTISNMRTLRVDNQMDAANMKTVLVAEDEESNYELVRIVLQKRYRLLRAHNGIEAVTINEDEHPDLILMDIRMPEMGGLDATRIIKEVDPDTPIIALSAYAFEENIREALAAGCNSFLAKPFRVEDLIEIIKKYIGE